MLTVMTNFFMLFGGLAVLIYMSYLVSRSMIDTDGTIITPLSRKATLRDKWMRRRALRK